VNDELIGHQLGSYRLVQVLGHGAFGSVYLGKHFLLEHKPPVAVKVLNTTLRTQEELDRFFNEALLLDKITHPNILQVLDANIYEGYPFFVAEYAPNGSLRDILDQLDGTPMPLTDTMHVLTQVGMALQHAHDQDIVHRDLKPANILFNAEGDALLADFGIALEVHKTSRVDEIGTPPYMAPEQFKGQVSKKSDQYALACITYELLTGQQLFIADDPYTIGYKHIYEPPIEPREINPDIPVEIEEVVLKALSKQREDRFESVADFIQALQNASGLSSSDLAGNMALPPDTPAVRQDQRSEAPRQSQHTPVITKPKAKKTKAQTNYPTPTMEPAARLSPQTDYSQQEGIIQEPETQAQVIRMAANTIQPGQKRPAQPKQKQPAKQFSHLDALWVTNTGMNHTYYAEPAVHDGIIFAGTYTTANWDTAADHFQVHALDANTGEKLWTFVVEHSTRAAPAVFDGLVYVCTGDENQRGKMYAIDAYTGQKRWAVGTKEYLWSTPIIDNGLVHFNSQHGMYAVDAETGQKRWAIAVEEGIFAPPTLIDDALYVGTTKGVCYSIDAVTGKQIDAFSDVGNIYAAVQTADKVICVGRQNEGLYGDDTTGKTLWYSIIDKDVSGGGLTTSDGVIYIGSHGHSYSDSARERLFAIDAATGDQLWVETIKNVIDSIPVVVDGILYVTTFGGGLYALNAAQGKVMASAIVGRGKLSRVAVDNGIVYVSNGEIHAFQQS
jgi:serine/threonine protein kinase